MSNLRLVSGAAADETKVAIQAFAHWAKLFATSVAMLTFLQSVLLAGQSQFAIDEARRGGGTIWEWLLLVATLYLAGLLLLFPAFLLKYRRYSATPRYARLCWRVALDHAGGFARDAFLAVILGTPLILIPTAIIFAIVNFAFFQGRSETLLMWWLWGIIGVLAAGSCAYGLTTQVREARQHLPGVKDGTGA